LFFQYEMPGLSTLVACIEFEKSGKKRHFALWLPRRAMEDLKFAIAIPPFAAETETIARVGGSAAVGHKSAKPMTTI